VAWKAVAGFGRSPVAVSDGRAYTIGAFAHKADLADGLDVDDLPEFHEGLHDVAGGLAARPGWHGKQGKMASYTTGFGDYWALCFDSVSGELLWRRQLTANSPLCDIVCTSSTPLVHDGLAYFQTADAVLTCLDAQSGEDVWAVNLWDYGADHIGKDGHMGSPLVTSKGVVVAFSAGAPDGYEFPAGIHRHEMLKTLCLDPTNGNVHWQRVVQGVFRTRRSSPSAGMVDGRETVVLSSGYGTFGLDAADGRVAWSYIWNRQLPAFAEAIRQQKERNMGSVNLWAANAGRHALIVGDRIVDTHYNTHDHTSSRTFCLQIDDGGARHVWSAPELSCQRTSYVVWQGRYVVGRDLRVYAGRTRGYRDEATGEEKEAADLSRRQRPEAIGRFQCYDVATGRLVWSSDAATFGVRDRDPGVYKGEEKYIVVGDRLIVASDMGVRVSVITEQGAEVLATYAAPLGERHGRPVLSEGRLYLRKQTPDVHGYQNQLGGPTSNLVCLDLQIRHE
jgi:outer membrane protein assembly factor BamB